MGKSNHTNKKYTKEELAGEIKRFVAEFSRTPIAKDFEKLEGYPSRKTFTNIFGNFNDAIRFVGFEPVGINFRDNKIKYDKQFLLNKINEYIAKYNQVPRMCDMTKFLGYEPKKYYTVAFGSWNNALIEAGLPLNEVSQYDDEFLESEFHRFVEEHGRIPTFREFNSSEYPSFWCYQNRFGSWNNAIQAYGYNIQSDIYNFDVIKSDLIKLCNKIKLTQNRNIITVSDIESCKEMAGYSCITKHCKLNNYTVRSLLNEYGFDLAQEGSGLNHLYEDGEKTKSRNELIFSNYLRIKIGLKYNADYLRDVKYKTFISNYHGNMNCDYVILQDDKKIYIEIAGILRDHKDNFIKNKPITSSKSKEKYRLTLTKKEEMFKQSGIKYHILFPCDLNEENLNNLFEELT